MARTEEVSFWKSNTEAVEASWDRDGSATIDDFRHEVVIVGLN